MIYRYIDAIPGLSDIQEYWVPLYVAPFGAVQKNHPDFDFGCFFFECFFFFVLFVAPFADVV